MTRLRHEASPGATRLAHPMPLYPSEAQIGRAVLGERASEWPALAVILERKGLPAIKPEMGGRYWPSVEKFFEAYENLDRGRFLESPRRNAGSA